MLKLKSVDACPYVVSAKLTKAIEYRKQGRIIKVEAGTNIVLDMDCNIGLIGIDHVQLKETDFIILNPS